MRLSQKYLKVKKIKAIKNINDEESVLKVNQEPSTNRKLLAETLNDTND